MRSYFPPSEAPDESIESVHKILLAATELFSRKPAKMVTVQMIAAESGVKLSLLYHHFGNKDYLYKVVFERAMERHRKSLLDVHKYIDEPEKLSRDEAIALLCLMICLVMDGLYDNDPQKSWHEKIALIEATYPTRYFDEFYEKYLKSHYQAVAKIMMRAMDETDFKNVLMRGVTIYGQMLAFRVEREMMRRLIGIEGYSPKELKRIKQIVLKNVLLQIGMGDDYKIRYDLIRDMGSAEIHAHVVNV